ncbi:ribosomal large P2 [Babesia ovata]|uniref:Ribosomal large P2 n=1 Tax=Babesia ovata TaxID=189622 RepID=A0A2H6K7U0_9APIC|nr:ribosomal large P2 [Babesia ovata]GBE59019.1 ribosomal large P2 [Babesia ovata]
MVSRSGYAENAISGVDSRKHQELCCKHFSKIATYTTDITRWLSSTGNESPSVADLKKILDAVGSEVDDDCLEGLVASMSGKTVHETIAAGMEKLQSVPTGGVAAAPAGGAAAPAGDAPAESKKAEPEPEEEEDDMGFSLFD